MLHTQLTRLALLCAAMPLCSLAATASAGQPAPAAAIPQQYIVVFHTPQQALSDLRSQQQWTSQQVNELVNKTGVTALRTFDQTISGMLVQADSQQLAALKKVPQVAYIEANSPVQLQPQPGVAQQNPTWGLDRVDQRNLPLDRQFNPAYNGQNVTTYVIDTGVMVEHSDFGGRARHGYDFVDNDAVAQDCNGHGTHVAGTIAGSEYGVAKQAAVVGVRVLNCAGSGTIAGVIAGVDWVAGQQPGQTKIGNMSLGGGASQALDDAVNRAVGRGVFMAVAAGNNNADACNYSPARAAQVFTVGSSTSADQRSGFSNFGNCVEIFAPGSDIKSAWNNGGSNTISGTSMASPHVAGVAALYLQQQPALSPAQLGQQLISNATPNVLSGVNGAPNRLVYSETGPVEPPPALKVTVNGAKQSSQYFNLNVPAGKSKLVLKLSGGSGDADLYALFNDVPDPFFNNCASENAGTSQEQCVVANPAAGNWQILVYGYAAFNNVTLTASYQ